LAVVLCLHDGLILLGDDDFDVAWVGHVWVDSTVGTVCSPSLLWSLVDLDVGDDELFGIETLRVGVGFSVLEETEEEFGRLLWPTTKSRTEMFGLSRSSSATSRSTRFLSSEEGHTVPMVESIHTCPILATSKSSFPKRMKPSRRSRTRPSSDSAADSAAD